LGKDNHEIVVEFLEQLLNEIKKSRGFDTQIEKDIMIISFSIWVSNPRDFFISFNNCSKNSTTIS
jgi:energy-converting hydrogenase Eha subunit F